jgi:hypothetical protein
MKCTKCSNDARWVDNGPRLQYWYCGDCKIEVVPPPPDLFSSLKDRYTQVWDGTVGAAVMACYYCTASEGTAHKSGCTKPKSVKTLTQEQLKDIFAPDYTTTISFDPGVLMPPLKWLP